MKHFVSRADDFGSSRSANTGIAKAIKAGFIKNVSVMAPCAFTEEAAEIAAGARKIAFGMHATLNAEWDRVKWGPVSDIRPSAGLTDEHGYFLPSPKLFAETDPPIEIILGEFDAQLDKLTRAGFHISYVDSHMLPEIYIPGLHEEMARWAERHGLIDHMYFYNLPDGWKGAAESGEIISFLRKLPDGQYFFLTHPAVHSEEMLQTGNAEVSGESVASGRGKEAKIFGNPITTLTLRSLGVAPLRYDEAKPLEKRLTVEEVRRIMG